MFHRHSMKILPFESEGVSNENEPILEENDTQSTSYSVRHDS